MVNENLTTQKSNKVPDWLNSAIWSTPPQPPPPPSSTVVSAAIDPYDPPFSRPDRHHIRRHNSDDADDVYDSPPSALPKPKTRAPKADSNGTSTSNGSDSIAVVSSAPTPEDISRHAQLLVEVSKKVINMKGVRRLAAMGGPDGPGVRSTVWKSEITRRLEQSAIVESEELKGGNRCLLPRSEVIRDEHPLSLAQSSVWNMFFQDTEIIEQIDRDVKRTHPDMQFFSGDSSLAKSNQESLRSILIVFAKLNPGIRYVQGMNEVLAPLFYVFRNDPDENYAGAAESDTFFCFVELIGGLRDNFCQQLDNSAVGIRSTITKLSLLLKEHDEELWRHLEVTCKVNPQFYAFRWITLLLTQEFSFTDILHIWDTLLSDSEGPQESLLRICCAMLILIRRRLLAGDFTSNLKLLQHYPSTNMSHLMYVASKLRAHPGN